MFYECPDCGHQIHNAENPFGWECLGGTDGRPQHPASRMLERHTSPPRPPATPLEHDLKTVRDIMIKNGWTRVNRTDRQVTASPPFTYLRLR